MQISMIKNKEGEGKQIMSQFPMRGIEPKWLKIASGQEFTKSKRTQNLR